MTHEDFLAKFPEYLTSYEPSPEAIDQISRLTVLVTIGPSGVGKTTLMQRLKVPFVPSDVSRRRRPQEIDGQDYNFCNNYDQIINNIEKGRFVQFAVGPVGEFYGTKATSYPKNGLATLAVVASAVPKFRSLPFASTVSAFITPPSYQEWMSRLQARSLPKDKLKGRLEEGRKSLVLSLKDPETHFILNDDLDSATKQIKDLLGGKVDNKREQAARQAAEQLLEKLINDKQNFVAHAGLKRLAEFEEVLRNYQIANNAKKILSQLNLVAIVGPTSTGRNTLIKYLTTHHGYYFIVSDTTRPPQVRDGRLEKDGEAYFFRSEEEILSDLKGGDFLEAEIIHSQQVSGISVRELDKAYKAGKTAIADVEIGGISNILELKPNTTAILLLPPSFEEWQNRIHERGFMPQDEHRRRLTTASRILEEGVKDSRLNIIINDDLKTTVQQVDELVRDSKFSTQQREKGARVAKELYERLQQELGRV